MKTLPSLAIAAALVLWTGAAFAAPHGPPPGGMPPPPPMGGMPPPPPPGPPPGGGQPHVGFSFNFGGGPAYFGGGPGYYNDCVSYGEAIANVADEGFSRIRLIDRTHRELIFQARRNYRSYEVDVDRCSGDINDVTRIR